MVFEGACKTTNTQQPLTAVGRRAEIAESAKEGLLALAMATGLQVMAAMFAQYVGQLCGPPGRHTLSALGTRMAARPGR